MEEKIVKGTITNDFVNANGYRETTICIGFVVGIMYNSEGTMLEWLLNKNGALCRRSEPAKIFSTVDSANRFIKKYQKNYTEQLFNRPYFYTSFQK